MLSLRVIVAGGCNWRPAGLQCTTSDTIFSDNFVSSVDTLVVVRRAPVTISEIRRIGFCKLIFLPSSRILLDALIIASETFITEIERLVTSSGNIREVYPDSTNDIPT